MPIISKKIIQVQDKLWRSGHLKRDDHISHMIRVDIVTLEHWVHRGVDVILQNVPFSVHEDQVYNTNIRLN